MNTLDIYTIGGIDYLTASLNGLAMIFSNTGYQSFVLFFMIVGMAAAAVRAAAELMVTRDMDACDAARAVGISACALSRGLALCGQLTGDRRQKKQKNRKTQPTLFGEVAA